MADVPRLSDEPDQRRVLRRAWPHLRPHRVTLGVAVAVNLLSTLAFTLVPVAIGGAVDAILARDRDRLLWLAGGVIGLVIARMLLLRLAEVLLVRAGERVVRDLRDLAVERLSTAPLRFVETHRGGDLLHRVTVEIADLAAFVRGQVPDLISLTGYVVFSTVVLLVYSWPLALLLAALFVPMMWLLGRRFRAAAEPAYAAEAAAQATVTATYQESLDAREQLQIAGAQARWRDRLEDDLTALQATVRRTQLSLSWLETAWIVQGVVTAVLLVAGGSMVASGALTVGAVVVFVLASRELFGSADELTYVIGEMVESKVGLARVLDLLRTTGRPERATAGPVAATGSLVARRISYSYGPDRQVLHDVDVRFEAGERVALAGETGSGKTTLAKLLAGLYTPDSGTVTYCGTDLADLPSAELRRRVILVPQQVHLITGTLADNLALAPGGPGRADFERAVRTLDLDGWVAALPDGFDTDLGPRGAHLSAGERQLVGLVRAALVEPDVVILDEATADLDPVTAHRLETAVGHLHADRTLIVIAHRQATIDAFPRVIRMAAGAIVQ
ncbi:ABC transporter ATP-binding protein [Dactylosporangium sp. NPDC005555]|uniref:ABC transporter ATP-binding protein n=1 Tax=Dactylosporangium sp. NPDC005555 TaxID=3154889 RepID=UPI0033BB6C17